MGKFPLRTVNENKLIEEQQINKFGHPGKRSISNLIKCGMINLDKPAGPTSHDVVATIKKILNISKAGHSGTLDPMVSGILPIALLKGTKVLYALLPLQKQYIANMQVRGDFISQNWDGLLEEFQNTIYQFPPLESHVARRLRKRSITKLQLLDIKDNQILFQITSESGTYIRTLCEDLGRAVGLVSYMKELRRIKSATFQTKDAKTLHNLFDSFKEFEETKEEKQLRGVISPIERMVIHLKEIIICSKAVYGVSCGVPLNYGSILAYSIAICINEIVTIKTAQGKLIALGQAQLNAIDFREIRKNVIIVRRVLLNYDELLS